MFRESFEMVMKKIDGQHPVLIFGAGKIGKELAAELIDNDMIPDFFFDNNDEIIGLSIYGIPVVKPKNLDKEAIYIISVMDSYLRYVFKQQLVLIGITLERICCYYPEQCGDYHKELRECNYIDADKRLFNERLDYQLNIVNPTTYNEIINWEKFNIKDESRTDLVDKVLVKKHVAKVIGEKYVTQTYGCWNNADKVNFDLLPKKFVLKTNNGSGRNIIVEDKRQINETKVKDKLRFWMQSNHYYDAFEIQYRDINPMILAEEYLEGVATTVYDYNIFCFHGEPEYIWCIRGSHRPGCCAAFYDKEWNIQPFSYGYPLDIYPSPRPNGLNEMLELSRILSKDYEHIRVDWYNLPDGRVLFGEMTFSTWAGLRKFSPNKYDYLFGKLIKGRAVGT